VVQAGHDEPKPLAAFEQTQRQEFLSWTLAISIVHFQSAEKPIFKAFLNAEAIFVMSRMHRSVETGHLS
jgi:hypothetical protein